MRTNNLPVSIELSPSQTGKRVCRNGSPYVSETRIASEKAECLPPCSLRFMYSTIEVRVVPGVSHLAFEYKSEPSYMPSPRHPPTSENFV